MVRDAYSSKPSICGRQTNNIGTTRAALPALQLINDHSGIPSQESGPGTQVAA
jgi:hypothetical protein